MHRFGVHFGMCAPRLRFERRHWRATTPASGTRPEGPRQPRADDNRKTKTTNRRSQRQQRNANAFRLRYLCAPVQIFCLLRRPHSRGQASFNSEPWVWHPARALGIRLQIGRRGKDPAGDENFVPAGVGILFSIGEKRSPAVWSYPKWLGGNTRGWVGSRIFDRKVTHEIRDPTPNRRSGRDRLGRDTNVTTGQTETKQVPSPRPSPSRLGEGERSGRDTNTAGTTGRQRMAGGSGHFVSIGS
jgi:hypothetical protein